MVRKDMKNRIRKAVRLYYGPKDMTTQEIADEMGYRRETVSGYLNHDFAEEIKSPYTDKEEREVRKALEEKFEDLEDRTERVVDEVLERGEYTDRLRAISELRRNHKELASFLEKVGALDTEPERHEVEHSGVPQVVINTSTSGKPDVPDVDESDEDV